MIYKYMSEQYLHEYYKIKHYISKLREEVKYLTGLEERDMKRRIMHFYEVARGLKKIAEHLSDIDKYYNT